MRNILHQTGPLRHGDSQRAQPAPKHVVLEQGGADAQCNDSTLPVDYLGNHNQMVGDDRLPPPFDFHARPSFLAKGPLDAHVPERGDVLLRHWLAKADPDDQNVFCVGIREANLRFVLRGRGIALEREHVPAARPLLLGPCRLGRHREIPHAVSVFVKRASGNHAVLISVHVVRPLGGGHDPAELRDDRDGSFVRVHHALDG
jgi:hypothetical protein